MSLSVSSAGDGSPARLFLVNAPRQLAMDAFGNLYVASTTTLRLVADADGDDRVNTIFGGGARDTFPESDTFCLHTVESTTAASCPPGESHASARVRAGPARGCPGVPSRAWPWHRAPMKRSCVLAAGLGLVVFAACDKSGDGASSATSTAALPVAVIAPVALVHAAAPDAAVFAFDQSSSKIGFTGRKVTGSHTGSFGRFSGEILVGKDAASSGVTLEIDMASVTSDSEKLTGHLKSADFFDVATIPQAAFVSTAIVSGGAGGATHTVQGNLSLHGVTKNIAFPATLQTSADRVTLQASFALDRKAFGINYPGRANDLISDHVDLSFDVTATPKPAAPPVAAPPADGAASPAAAPAH